jgi:hypothetical protein
MPVPRFDEGRSKTAIALRDYWRAAMPNYQFSSRNEFADSYVKWSIVFFSFVIGFIVWRNHRNLAAPDVVGDSYFTKLRLLTRTKISPDSILLQLELPADALPPVDAHSPLDLDIPVQSVYIADPDSLIQRPYTPLFADVFDPTSPHHTGKLDLLVKHYRDGDVSTYLHMLAVGAKVMVRGPVRSWSFRERDYDDLVFVRARSATSNASVSSQGTDCRRHRCEAVSEVLEGIQADRAQGSRPPSRSSPPSSRHPPCQRRRTTSSSPKRQIAASSDSDTSWYTRLPAVKCSNI